ncbi:A/G-specific adenine glycosylase [Kocuria palustris]|uniref:A/G-specific adenine glycosylase n=1 Tax=Kocuria palustris TaxID=71999 RepID=UPI0021A80E10|nr:A/G-specific adenine glycosylase [Kocuria palustris]MCT1834587.1 A/G-specific adenine glycosylase [Kocuria palustris]
MPSPHIADPSPQDAQRLAQIRDRIAAWYASDGRDLPWRCPERTAWGVLVSEIMLQQTPVVRVLPRWLDWMRRWPSPADLAEAPTADVLRAWDRLGYPRRALRLQAAAQAIVADHGGRVPREHDQLLALPGIGAYTAAAVSAFAFGERQCVIDTNIRRVHARLFSGKGLPSRSLTAAETRLARSLLPEQRAASVVWNQSVMELGALICTARSPRCGQCPVQDLCAWIAAGRPEPEEAPRGQSWKGTDRQVRGAVMAVLRAADQPVPESWLTRDQQVTLPRGASADLARPLEALLTLESPVEQRQRAVDGLVSDGLAHRRGGRIALPG